MDPAQLTSILVQLPFLAIFIWFSLTVNKENRNEAQNREKQWMIFLTEENKQREREIDKVSESMLQLSTAVVNLTTAISRHDLEALKRFNELKDTIRNKRSI